MCLFPKLIDNPKYKPNKKNRGIIPPVYDKRVLTLPIGCSECMECRKAKAREWQTRLLEDIKKNRNGKFITLTFSNQAIANINSKIPQQYKDRKQKDLPLVGYKRDNAIAKYAVRHFLERWRKKYKTSLRHWFVTELGHEGTENIHLHGIIWTHHDLQEVRKHWQYGYVWIGDKIYDKIQNYVNERTVSYVVKYVSKMDHDHRYYKSKVLTSAGIGNNYVPEIPHLACEQYIHFNPENRKWSLRVKLKKHGSTRHGHDWKNNRYKGTETREYYRTTTGHKIALPIYWRNKIYTEEEREKLWIHKLDTNIRYVCGEKIDVSKTHEEYFKIQKHYQEINNRLGYGNLTKDWNRLEYEEHRRIKLLDKRTGTKTIIRNNKYTIEQKEFQLSTKWKINVNWN